MDGDDICMPDRLRKQVEYMRLHPEIYADRVSDKDDLVSKYDMVSER